MIVVRKKKWNRTLIANKLLTINEVGCQKYERISKVYKRREQIFLSSSILNDIFAYEKNKNSRNDLRLQKPSKN